MSNDHISIGDCKVKTDGCKQSAPVDCSVICDEVIRLRAALTKIEKWFGEFPPTGRTWDDGTPMSYSAAFGSNGERDYMRTVAHNALSPNAKVTGRRYFGDPVQ